MSGGRLLQPRAVVTGTHNFRMYLRDVDWIHLAQVTDQLWILLNMVMKIRVP